MTTQALIFAVATDIHQDIMHDGPQRLQAFIDAANQARVDMAIQLGDFCQPIPANRAFLAEWEALDVARYNVLGNHDMDGGFTRQDTVAYMSMSDRYYSFDRKGWHCVVLDGNDPSEPPQAGYARGVAANQRAWLAADLQGTDLPVLIFIHQSLDRGEVDGDRDVLDILAAHNRKVDWRQVVAVFSGHHHLDYAVSIDGIWHVQINSMSDYWLGDDFKHVRYSPAADAAFPNIKYTAPYKDPLYAIVRAEPDGSLYIEGIESQWVGPSPSELGYLQAHGAGLPLAGASLRPGIATRHLPSP